MMCDVLTNYAPNVVEEGWEDELEWECEEVKDSGTAYTIHIRNVL
jgi:hypothetical protein